MSSYRIVTRVFKILLGMACFVGIMTGIRSFVHSSPFGRFRCIFAAGIMIFISSFFVLLAVTILTLRFLSKCFGDWHFYMLVAFFAGIFCLCAHRMYESRRVAGRR
ncbi:hypothetical protein ABG768_014798 [Culter alburnus]|uniref:Uncharacterized protein n=1 Tax=Culter alburnus TaxID=194366 RepID=A0AAW1Z3L7_CULAL